jgi:hypothetical protein
MLLLAKQQKSRIEQLFSKNVKREMADIGKVLNLLALLVQKYEC